MNYDIPYKGVHAFRRSATAQMKRMGMNDSDIMEIMGWQDVTMLRRYVSTVGLELAQLAHQRFTPGSVL
jgi:integrase